MKLIGTRDRNGKDARAEHSMAGKATIARFPISSRVSFVFYDHDLTLNRLYLVSFFSSFSSFSFFFFSTRRTSPSVRLKANTHRRRLSGITRLKTVVYLANLLTSFGFDSFPLLATFVSILQRAV